MDDNGSGNMLKLKKVAFVAMPFGRKSTGVADGNGPSHVDCDALWEKAFRPALTKLDYLPIRADNQTGSVIIKDMLEQLVHADLVLADISIPNGNVYYEAGIRHAACDAGCVLLRASWSRPLFDLAQITHLQYPYPSTAPTESDYEAIAHALTTGIPSLADSKAPVFELTRAGANDAGDSSQLREVSRDVFEFQQRLAAAALAAADNRKDELRALIDERLVRRLPRYALRDLTASVRDHLTWGELSSLITLLPEEAFGDPYFREQDAHALTKQGRHGDAIALLETVNQRHGATPERCATVGGQYSELARDEPNNAKKRRYTSQAIAAYRTGMRLDLNEHVCAQKLLIALVARHRDAEDLEEARACAAVVRLAASRAAARNPDEIWIDTAFAVLAFFDRDASEASRRAKAILDRDWTNPTLVELVQDLQALSTAIDEDERDPFANIVEDITAVLPVAQAVLMERVLPRIRQSNQKYRKFKQVHARPAVVGEVIVSTPSGGEETTKTAQTTDEVVVKNLTDAEEQYLVGRRKFEARYTYVRDVDDRWKLYDPVGEVLAAEITRELATSLQMGEEFYIMAPWGSEQLAREGDMLVSPVPTLDEVYRVARKEFDETYRLVADHEPSREQGDR